MRLRNRRGAFIVITGILILALFGIGAVAVDFSRLWTLRNELQTAADAGAHAGAIQLSPSRFVSGQGVQAAADALAKSNLVMGQVPSVDSLILGNWDPSTKVFDPNLPHQNAIKVVVSASMNGLFMRAFGLASPTLKARAVGWSEAPVATSGCQKPWAIPFENLMFAINVHRGIPNTTANLNRPFDQVHDIAALNAMSDTARTFDLKIADNGNGQQLNQVNQGAATATTMPGNYQAVRLGKYWDKAMGTYANPGPNTGGQAYKDNIEGVDSQGNPVCHALSVGDSLQTETGNKVGPTVQSVEPAVCATIAKIDSLPTFGDCRDSSGSPPNIKAAFYRCGSGCNGNTVIGVEMLGSFELRKMYPSNCRTNGQNPSHPSLGNCAQSQIVGVFQPVQSSGPVGGGSTTLQRPILTQ